MEKDDGGPAPSGCIVEHHVWTEGCPECERRPPPQWFAAAIKELRNATVPGLCEADDPHCGYPLIDMLSDDGGTVDVGIERAYELACDVAMAVWDAHRAMLAERAKGTGGADAKG